MKYFLYILKSKATEKYYTGISQNPERRLLYNNTIEKGFTSRYRPWIIVYKKIFETRTEASFVENKIKNWKSKIMIEKIISGKIKL